MENGNLKPLKEQPDIAELITEILSRDIVLAQRVFEIMSDKAVKGDTRAAELLLYRQVFAVKVEQPLFGDD